MVFNANKGPAMKKRKGWLLCRQPTGSAMGRNRCHIFVFSLTCHPHPVLAHEIRDSTNSCGIELNRKLSCRCEKIANIITEWHNWTRVHSNWTEGQEIQTDAKKALSRRGLGSSGPSPRLAQLPVLGEGAGPGQRAGLLPTGPSWAFSSAHPGLRWPVFHSHPPVQAQRRLAGRQAVLGR